MQNRVRNRPYLCSELVSVSWEDPQGRRRSGVANLEEIGETSAMLLAESIVPRGSTVYITSGEHHLRGTVEGITFDRVLGFFVEVALQPESRWSEKWFTPAHLLALWKGVEEEDQQVAPKTAA